MKKKIITNLFSMRIKENILVILKTCINLKKLTPGSVRIYLIQLKEFILHRKISSNFKKEGAWY